MASISLKGARFDDIILKDYKENINPESKQVTLLSPRNTLNPYFVEFGWGSKQISKSNLPDENSVWELIEGKQLGPQSPITIKWLSPDGIEFLRKIEIDQEPMDVEPLDKSSINESQDSLLNKNKAIDIEDPW